LSDACEAMVSTEFAVEITVQPTEGETESQLHERALLKLETAMQNNHFCTQLFTEMASLAESLSVQLPSWAVATQDVSTGCFVTASAHNHEPVSIVSSSDQLPGRLVDSVVFEISVAEETRETIRNNIFGYQQAIAHAAGVYVGQVSIAFTTASRSRRLLEGVILTVSIEVESAIDADSLKLTVEASLFISKVIAHLRDGGIEVSDLVVVQSSVRHEQTFHATTVVNQPIINIAGSDVNILEAVPLGYYNDAGATCFDLTEGELSERMLVTGTLFPSPRNPGTYSIHYMCTNSQGFSAEVAVRHVVVRDTECPVCVATDGPDEFEASFPYMDAGAHCSDSLDGPIEDVIVLNDVDVERVGVYKVSYRARDAAGNWNDGSCKGSAQSVRTVHVIDTLQPVLSLHYKGKHLVSSAGGISDANGEDNPATYRGLLAKTAQSTYVWAGAATILAGVGAVFGAFAQQRQRSQDCEDISQLV